MPLLMRQRASFLCIKR